MTMIIKYFMKRSIQGMPSRGEEQTPDFRIEKVFILLMFIVMAYQLMIPPIVGMANNGDFDRLMPWAGLQYLTGEYNDKYWFYINRKFSISGETHRAYFSSEVVFLKLSVWINRVIFKDGLFDLRVIGSLHSIFFLFALFLVLMAFGNTGPPFYLRLIAGGMILFIFCDVGYVAYFNSFYSEPAALISLFWMTGMVMQGARQDQPGWLWFLGFFIAAIVFVGAKTQYSPLGFLLMGFSLRWSLFWKDRGVKTTMLLVSIALCLFSFWAYQDSSKQLRGETLYSSVFYGILKNSPDPKADLSDLGLKSEYSHLAGTHPYSPNVPIHDPEFQKDFYGKVNYWKIVKFYMTHPSRLWKVLDVGTQNAFSIRPHFLGNFEKSTGLPPGSLSQTFSSWSKFKKYFFPHSVWFLLIYLCFNIGAVILLRRRIKGMKYKLWIDFYAVLVLMLLSQLFISIIGAGESDLAKHLFLFNVIFDVSLVSIALFLTQKIVSRFYPRPNTFKLSSLRGA